MLENDNDPRNSEILAENVQCTELEAEILKLNEKLELINAQLNIYNSSSEVCCISSEKISFSTHLSSFGNLISMPVGAVVPFAGTAIPDGWLLCNGEDYDIQVYNKLYETINAKKLPDLDNRLVKGAAKDDLGKTSDNSKVILEHFNFQQEKFLESSDIKYVKSNTEKNFLPWEKDSDYKAFNIVECKHLLQLGTDNPVPIDITPPHLKMKYIIKAR